MSAPQLGSCTRPGRRGAARFVPLGLLLLAALPARSGEGYRDAASLRSYLESLAARHPALASLEAIGHSLEGRPIWALTLAARAEHPPERRPALAIVAGLDGTHLHGTETALRLARLILEGHLAAGDPAGRRLLEDRTVHVLPRINPDGQEVFFRRPLREHSGNLRARDDDHDGEVDEDGPEDLDGDGRITRMRVRDPEGEWVLREADDRLLRKAVRGKGEAGRYRIYREGTDSDGDGAFNEDGPGAVDLDRNFPQDYREGERGNGPYPVSEIESRALADFVIQHPSIAVALTYGPGDNLSGDPPVDRVRKEGPQPGKIHDEDRPYLETIRERFQEITGFKAAPPKANGAFFHWLYHQRGILSLATPLWKGPEAGKKEDRKEADGEASGERKYPDTEDGRWLRLSDTEREGAGFAPWKPYEHPGLGKVEIGGFVPYFRVTPPIETIGTLVEKQYSFVRFLGEQLPRITLEAETVRDLGAGFFEVRADLVNTGFLPTSMARGKVTRQVRPVVVQLDLAARDVISGEVRSPVYALPGSGGRKEFRWLIRGERGDEIELTASSPSVGHARVTVQLEDSRGETTKLEEF